jgi:hypothetical protein
VFGAGAEFIAPCAVATFDAAIELGGSGRQDMEVDLAALTLGFEVGDELRRRLGWL